MRDRQRRSARRCELHNVCRHLRHYRHHVSSNPTPFASWETLPNQALLAIMWHRAKGKEFWHWVVFVRDSGEAYVLDSKKTLKHHGRISGPCGSCE